MTFKDGTTIQIERQIIGVASVAPIFFHMLLPNWDKKYSLAGKGGYLADSSMYQVNDMDG